MNSNFYMNDSCNGTYSYDNFNQIRKKSLLIKGKEKFFINSRYEIDEILGKGSYGTVCSAFDIKMKNSSKKQNKIAVKKIANIFNKEVLLKRAIRELKLMRHFRGHKNVIIHTYFKKIYLY